MPILLLDGSLEVNVFFEESDSEFEDNVCISIAENCPDEEKVFRGDETVLYITAEQACQLARVLNIAAQSSMTCDAL
jgi:hypothetical protein